MSVKFNANVLEQLINTSPAGMFIVDKDRKILFANESYAKMFGYTKEEILHVNTKIFHISEANYHKFAKEAFNAVSKGEDVEIDFQVKKRDGTLFWIHIVGSLVKNQDLILWTIIDITKKKENERKLEELNYNLKQYLNAMDKIDIGIFVVDEDFSIRYMNNTMIDWFGDQNGKICYKSVANLDEPCPYCKLYEVINENKKVMYEPNTPDGQSFDIVATSIKNADGTTSKMEVIRNITKEKIAQENLIKEKEKLDYQAHHDFLTKLPNRVLLQDRLQQAIIKAKVHNEKFALLFLDLDHFKEINDSLGHHIGDRVLQVVTKRLLKIIEHKDTLARIGGDEFTMIVENLKDEQSILPIAQKILTNLSEPILINKQELYISSSIGISIFPDDGRDVKDLLKYSDSAMYKAKSEGRNNFKFYSSEMTQLAFHRITMESKLRTALKNEEFVVYYQPQVDATKDKLVGMEALVRWKDSTKKIIPPSEFIPLAESTSLIVNLDRFVMKSAMTQFAKWYDDGYNPGILAMNLSVKQLQENDFIPFLKALMLETRCKAKWMELEVTESQIMEDPKEAIKILTEISSLGIRLAIDDFGTGYSSLAYLKKLPIDKLKIDQSFVFNLPDDEEDVAIAQAVIALSKSLKLLVIAEGVETKEQKDFLVKNGCSNIQGYFYSRPVDAKEFEEKILKNKKLMDIK